MRDRTWDTHAPTTFRRTESIKPTPEVDPYSLSIGDLVSLLSKAQDDLAYKKIELDDALRECETANSKCADYRRIALDLSANVRQLAKMAHVGPDTTNGGTI